MRFSKGPRTAGARQLGRLVRTHQSGGRIEPDRRLEPICRVHRIARIGERRARGAMIFTIEFFRIRESDNAHAILDRIPHIATDLESVKVKAKSLFETLNLPQNPDGLRILDEGGKEVFCWTPADG
jgi:hypothetical protein